MTSRHDIIQLFFMQTRRTNARMFSKRKLCFHYTAIAVLENIFAIRQNEHRLSNLNSGQKIVGQPYIRLIWTYMNTKKGKL